MNLDIGTITAPPPARKKRKPPGTLTPAKIDGIIDGVIKGDEFEQLIANLSPAEQELFWEQIAVLRCTGEVPMDDLWKIDYERPPPTIKEFVGDDYWMGSVCRKSEESEGLFPAWRKVLENDFDVDSRIHNVVVTGSLGIGKCLGHGTPVRMFDGTTLPAESIKVGDRLMGDDGTVRNVVNTTVGRADMFEITPHRPRNGLSWRCNADHILVLKHKNNVIKIEAGMVAANPGKYKNHRILRANGYDLPARALPLEPYWFGLWIGDGNVHSPCICINADDPEIAEYHTAYAKKLGMLVNVYGNKHSAVLSDYSIVSPLGGKGQNVFTNALRDLGVLGKAGCGDQKFIPEIYVNNSRENRRQLLAGIIDTDGCQCTNGCYEVALANFDLAKSVQNLSWSLGYACGLRKRVVYNKKFKAPATAYRMIICGAYDLPTRIKRKQARVPVATRSGGNRRRNSVSGFTIQPVGVDDYFGFELDGNHQFLLADGTITHNSFVSVLLILYKIAIARCMRNPQSFLGLAKGSAILYVMLSVTKSSVADTVFGDAKNFMSNSPFFMEECKFSPAKKYAGLHIPLGRNIFLTGGSRGQHILGRNTMGVILDEGNWRLESNPDTKAYELYNEVRHRLTNRFQKINGYLPALSILASSARDESATTETVIDEIRRNNSPMTERVYRFSVYNIKKYSVKYSAQWFKVEHSVKNVDPRILSGWYDEKGVPTGDDAHEAPNPAGRIELVPKDFISLFARNVKVALQSVCGVATGGSHRLFPSTEPIEKAILVGRGVGLVNPCPLDIFPISDEDTKQVWDFLVHKLFLTRKAGRVIPLRDPGAKRYAHIDLATANVAGVAVCHVVGQKRVQGVYDTASGQVFDQYRPIVAYDFLLGITAGNTKPISLKKIQDFLFWLRDFCGYTFGMISADTYQCLDGSTLIETLHGLLPLAAVKKGDIVMSRSGPNKVTRLLKYSADVRLCVIMHNGEIIGTPNHKMLVKGKHDTTFSWKPLQLLQPEDIIAASCSLEKHAFRVFEKDHGRVVRLTVLPPGDVYDLTVEGDPSYTANGYVSHNSSMPLQIFENRGIKCSVLSLDRTKVPYYAWRSGFEDGRIMLFEHKQLLIEAEHLIDHPNGKIDHPEKTAYGVGSKDLCDAAAGAYYDAVTGESGISQSAQESVSLHSGFDAVEQSEDVITVVPKDILKRPPVRTVVV